MLKSVRVWWMYWRYRNITQRRQRLQMAWHRRRKPAAIPDQFRAYRERGMAATPYRRPGRRPLIALLLMVLLLTVLATYGGNTHAGDTVLKGVGALIVLAGVYAGMRFS